MSITLKGQQIDALANKIAREINEEIDKYNNSVLEAAVKDFKKTRAGKALAILAEELPGGSSYDVNTTNIKRYLNYDLVLKSRVNQYPYGGSIKDDIIIETIECDDINSIIERIKAKYS